MPYGRCRVGDAVWATGWLGNDTWAAGRLGDGTYGRCRLDDETFGRRHVWAMGHMGDGTFGVWDIWATGRLGDGTFWRDVWAIFELTYQFLVNISVSLVGHLYQCGGKRTSPV